MSESREPVVTFAPDAIDDLAGLAAFLGAENRATARRFSDAVRTATLRLVTFPYLGAKWRAGPGAPPGVRRWAVPGFASYLIFYLPTTDGVRVLRIIHGARDIEALFEASE